MMADFGPVVITARDVYDAVILLKSQVERLVDQNIEMSGDVKDHEQRIRTLERARWPLPTLSALIAVAALLMAAVQFIGGR
jgi:hypothetical protein